MSVPLPILDPTFRNESLFEGGKFLVDSLDVFDCVDEFVSREVMSMTMMSVTELGRLNAILLRFLLEN